MQTRLSSRGPKDEGWPSPEGEETGCLGGSVG